MTSSFSPAAARALPAMDVGLGTAYERTAIYRRILSWCGDERIRTAAEGPLDGMAGMPGLHALCLAQKGVRVTVASADERALERVRRVYRRAGLEALLETAGERLPDRRFDVVISFNGLPLAADWRAYLTEQAERAERLLVSVTHAWSYGAWLSRGLRRLERRPHADLFDHEATRPRLLRSELERLGRIVAEAWVDCPWWPDLFVPAGATLAGALGARFSLDSPEPRFVYDAESFPYANGGLPAELSQALARHPQFERSRLAPVFAHHHAYWLARD